jgi:hypothetical protein
MRGPERHHSWPMAPPGPVRPAPVSPVEGAVLPSGDPGKGVPPAWEFTWSKVPGADRYHVHVIRRYATAPLVDEEADEPR